MMQFFGWQISSILLVTLYLVGFTAVLTLNFGKLLVQSVFLSVLMFTLCKATLLETYFEPSRSASFAILQLSTTKSITKNLSFFDSGLVTKESVTVFFIKLSCFAKGFFKRLFLFSFFLLCSRFVSFSSLLNFTLKIFGFILSVFSSSTCRVSRLF